VTSAQQHPQSTNVGKLVLPLVLAAVAVLAVTVVMTHHPAKPSPTVPATTAPPLAAGGCHTAVEGEECFKAVIWAMQDGINAHPDWYPGLTAASDFTKFQEVIHKHDQDQCPQPCEGPGPSAPAPPPVPQPVVPDVPILSSDQSGPSKDSPCLCIFDVDRTLTGKQGEAERCPGNRKVGSVFDTAYGGGKMVVSQLGLGLQTTFCGKCYRGIVTAGIVGGPGSAERGTVLKLLGGEAATLSSVWSPRDAVASSLVVGAIDGRKQESAKGIVEWFRKQKGINIPNKKVHFFDDRDGNVPPFAGTGFNARQVSCKSRGVQAEGLIGRCGATPAEVVETAGVSACR